MPPDGDHGAVVRFHGNSGRRRDAVRGTSPPGCGRGPSSGQDQGRVPDSHADGRISRRGKPDGSVRSLALKRCAAVAWRFQDEISWSCSPLIIDTLNGADSWRLPGDVANIVAAVSPDGKSVAFFGTFKPPGSGVWNIAANRSGWVTGLQYASSGTSVNSVFQRPTRIGHPEYPVKSIGWSRDGRAFVYDYQGKVEIYDLTSKTSRMIALGSNPEWSPDGRWISFRSPEGLAAAIDPVTLKTRDLFGHRKILAGVHWSPDSRYVMLTEQLGFLSNLIHFRDLFLTGVHARYSARRRRERPLGMGWLGQSRRLWLFVGERLSGVAWEGGS
jgi:hypothetical protein